MDQSAALFRAVSGVRGRLLRRRAIQLVGTALLVAAAVGPGAALAQTAPFCAPGQSAQFRAGLSSLRDRLGDAMGSPVECEHAAAAQNGDTIQQTTTGVVTANADRSRVTFTDGQVHYILTDGQLTRWQGADQELPALAPGEAGYLDATVQHRERLAALYAALQEYQRLADADDLDQIDGNALLALRYQFSAAQQAFNGAAPSARFDRYVQTVRQATQQGQDAASFLLRAQHPGPGDDHRALVAQARPLVSSGARSRQDADDQLSFIVPVAVTP